MAELHSSVVNILIVDAQPANLRLLRVQLEAEGHTVVDAGDGVEALQVLENGKVDAVISAALTPNMDGFRLCLEIRKSTRFATLPFIVYASTDNSPADRNLAIAVGADCYLTKPVPVPALLAALAIAPRVEANRKQRSSTQPDPVEMGVIKHYNAALVAKLEQKNSELAAANAELRANVARYHGTLDKMLEGCQIVGHDWRYLYVNDTAARHGQRTKDELMGRTMLECFPGIEHSSVFPVLRRCMTERTGARMENEFVHDDGSKSWFELSIQPVPEGIFVLSLDMTEQKRDAQKVRDQLDELLRWQEVMLNREDRVQALKAEVNDLLAKHGQPPRYSDPGLELRRQEALAREAGERQRIETLQREQYDQLSASEQTASRLLTVAEKSRRALLSVLEDEKHSGHELRESEERFRQLAENINEVFWMTDPRKNTMLYISPAYATIWGRSCESLYARPETWMEAIHPEDRARVAAAAARQFDGFYDEVYRIGRPDGTERWVRDRAFPVRNAAGSVYRIVGIAADITERKRSELRAAAQHAVTAVLAESGPLMATALRILEIICRQLDWSLGVLWTIDRTTKTLRCVETWHPPSTEFSPFAEACRTLAFGAGEGVPGAVWKAKEPWWISDVTQEPTFVRRRQAGALGLRGALAFPIKLRDEVFGVVEFFSLQSRPPDEELMRMFSALGTQIGQFIERKHLEDQFRQAQKMEAIGTLAGGIAHDFNNVLAAIGGFTELARMESAGNPEVLQCLRAVSQGCARAADLVRQILAFSRLQEQQRKSIQLWPVVDEALKLLRATIPSTIQFDISLIRRGPTVLADPTQIHQVVMNLATNAAHAMRAQGGRLGVRLEICEVDADLAGRHPGLRPGRYVRLTVSDTGHGMDEATLGRIYDPFFTTKGPGEGTGLGLAVVHGIMQSHDGVVAVFSQPGAGTQFQLYFPADATEMLEAVVDAPATPHGKGERILVIDDELPLVTMLQKVLERLGYRVDAHTVPAAACEAFRADPHGYALVITDLTMPGMTGTDLASQVLTIRPGVPIILTTGYNVTLTRDRARTLGFQEMLMKPLTVHSLGAAVHRVLVPAHPTKS